MKTLTLLFALSLCAVAQTTSNVPGVTLSGPLAHLMIENHSGKAVLWLSFKRSVAQDADPREGGQWFIDQAGGLPDGASAELQRYNSKTNVVTSAAIVAAIFADGEFRGKAPGPFRQDVEVTFRFMREEWQWAQAGEWDKRLGQMKKTLEFFLS
jgi:hypothetical protein